MAYDKVSRKLETPAQTVEREAQECEARRRAWRERCRSNPVAKTWTDDYVSALHGTGDGALLSC